MSEFTDEMVKYLRKGLNKNYKERAKVIKKLTEEYKKNTLVIYNEIIKNELKTKIEYMIEKSFIDDRISTDLVYRRIDDNTFKTEKNRLERNGLNLTYVEWSYLKEKYNYAYMGIKFFPNEHKKAFEVYGTEKTTDGLSMDICFDKNELKRLAQENDLKFTDNDAGIIKISMSIPQLEYLLSPANNKENQKLKIYK